MSATVPARVHNVEAARAQFGDLFEPLVAALDRLDPPADAAAEALAGCPDGHAVVEAAVRGQGDPPAALRELVAAADAPPAWVDWDRIDRGCHLFLRAGAAGGFVLGLRSLIFGYAAPAGNKPLMLSGQLRERAPRRLAETARFVAAVCEPGGLRSRGEGHRISLKVRLMHAQVRRLVARSGRWDAAAWSAPVNQHDMLATGLLFSQVFLDGLRLLGLRIDPAEADDYIHLWRYVCWLLGVEPALLPDREAEARRISECIYLTQGPPDADSRALTAALLQAPLQTARNDAERRAAELRVTVSRQLCRLLVGNALADALGVPQGGGQFALPLLRRALAAADGLRGAIPGLDAAVEAAGRRYWEVVVDAGLGGDPATFAMPQGLAAMNRRT